MTAETQAPSLFLQIRMPHSVDRWAVAFLHDGDGTALAKLESELQRIIGEAVAAAVERCAGVADKEREQAVTLLYDQDQADELPAVIMARRIARAIRKGE